MVSFTALVSAVVLIAGAHALIHPRKKVLVLGAGVSGISTAKYLQEGGVGDFLVLEGQDYIGGRMKLVPFAGYKVEAGANWIHFATDEGSKALWDLKAKVNLRGIWSNYSDIIIRNESGADVTDLKLVHQLEKAESLLEDEQEARKSKKLKDIPGSVGLSLLGWKRPRTPVGQVLEYFSIDFEYSVRLEQVSFNNMDARETDFYSTDQRGFYNIFNETVETFKDKIKLNERVARVKYNNTGVEVTTSSGDVYSADYVVCTFSTGVLASDMVEFVPPLPKWKQEAYLSHPMSIYTKIFLKFDHKFWDDNEYILHASMKRGYYPVFQDLARPGIFPVNSSILLVTVTDTESRRIERQPFAETKREIVEMLKKIYGNNVTEPTDIFYDRWSQNPYIRGAYSEVVVGTGSKSFEELAKNLGNLHFAGEAYDEEWYNYLQGAWLTGQQKGKKLSSLIKCLEAGRGDCIPTAGSHGTRSTGAHFFIAVILSFVISSNF
ncbi:polyamine oxidase 7 [Nematostella vectensis]|uniref:polyamine oxidase 7 n=1 Tax=Nematostella vectensis TaxID=45351 RepID=UPI0020777798|nr:polyamine oxidase 7 [Nematostella vectensis]XP_032239381.2 polyamine oxidase 7 [Nematostella vectensis]